MYKSKVAIAMKKADLDVFVKNLNVISETGSSDEEFDAIETLASINGSKITFLPITDETPEIIAVIYWDEIEWDATRHGYVKNMLWLLDDIDYKMVRIGEKCDDVFIHEAKDKNLSMAIDFEPRIRIG